MIFFDGDFVSIIHVAQDKGKIIENIRFQNKFFFHLKQECNISRKIKKEEIEFCFDQSLMYLETVGYSLSSLFVQIF